MTERSFNLVVPLPYKGTAMRTTETASNVSGRSGAVSSLIGFDLRRGDVDSTHDRSTRTTPTMPGTRTSTTATRTTITSRTPAARVRSADQSAVLASASFEALVQAYFDCRKNKRNSASALAFEMNLENNLRELHAELEAGEYRPGRSICFVITRPKPREVWAADFRDRIVHHLLYNQIAPRFLNSFVADSCACIPGRGTLYAARRLEAKIRSITQNWSKPAWYLKCDVANFFVSINKPILHQLLATRITEPWWLWLAEVVLFHDPRLDFEYRGPQELLERVPPYKRLTNQPEHLGLPIGNLSSQFFANVYMNVLDQHVKHRIGARHYVRYVDDFVLLHQSSRWLHGALQEIDAVLPERLGIRLNHSKTIIQPIARGVDFVGQVIRPWASRPRRRMVGEAVKRVSTAAGSDELVCVANSYFGLLNQANSSHRDRGTLARAVLRRGHMVNAEFTKTYRRPHGSK